MNLESTKGINTAVCFEFSGSFTLELTRVPGKKLAHKAGVTVCGRTVSVENVRIRKPYRPFFRIIFEDRSSVTIRQEILRITDAAGACVYE